MSMTTRCPSCNTLFRVTPPQLQAHYGQVRCGRCMTVFDGFQGLAVLAEHEPLAAAHDPAEGERPLPQDEATALPIGAEPPRDAAPVPDEARKEPPAPAGFEFGPPEAAADFPPSSVIEPAAQLAPIEVGARPRPVVSSSAPIKGDQLFLEQARSSRRRGRRIWTAGSALMLLALAGQAAYFYRSDLIATYPLLKPVYVQVCDLFQCSVALPQRPKLINIEASDLQSVDPARPGVIQLTATLRNHAGYDVGYPALDLVLTNTKEHTLARRIFLPEEYLGRGRNAQAGIPANAEITIRLELDTGELGAAGFRLDLLPAPAR